MSKLTKSMLSGICLLLAAFACCDASAQEEVRQWSDASGNYKFDATLVTHNDTKVILQRGEDLVSMAVADLSEEDRKYLESKKGVQQAPDASRKSQTWTLSDGLKVTGAIVDFGVRNVVVRSHLGKTFVNDRRFDNLPEVYQAMVPKIVSHFEGKKFENQRELEAWLTWQPGKEKTYECKGVLLELENGDRLGIPLFFFSAEEQAILNPAYERWASAQKVEEKEQESTNLRAQTFWYHPPIESRDVWRIRRISEIQLQLQAYESGLVDLWEVQLVPAGGQGMWRTVVVPGRNSDQAANAALRQSPGYQIGGIAKVRRRY